MLIRILITFHLFGHQNEQNMREKFVSIDEKFVIPVDWVIESIEILEVNK
jgi:hypothetical protein